VTIVTPNNKNFRATFIRIARANTDIASLKPGVGHCDFAGVTRANHSKTGELDTFFEGFARWRVRGVAAKNAKENPMTHRTVNPKALISCAFLFATVTLVSASQADAGAKRHRTKRVYASAQQHYDVFDSNRDGYLNVREHAEKRFDTNRNGYLDRYERMRLNRYLRSAAYRRVLRSNKKAERSASRYFRKFDRNADGYISGREARSSRIGYKFRFVDRNRSGYLDRYELVSHFGGVDVRVATSTTWSTRAPRRVSRTVSVGNSNQCYGIGCSYARY